MNKLIVTIYIPYIEEEYDIFLPKTKRIEETIALIIYAVKQISNQNMPDKKYELFNKVTGDHYSSTDFVYKTDIQNGTKLLLM